MTASPPYDHDLRRETPLALKLKERIARDGPITVADYVMSCLWDEHHGYYATRMPIGAKGDFITAPEISQIFGELIGLWAAVTWQQMGSPSHVTLAEAGPGRGTLMRDALRATQRVAGFHEAARVDLIEQSPALEALQRTTLAEHAGRIRWSERGRAIEGPLILFGNEFLDCFPVEQAVKSDRGWEFRCVDLDARGALVFGFDPNLRTCDAVPGRLAGAPLGSVFEFQRNATPPWLADAAARGPVAALFIDYGHTATELGETLQAVRAHQFEHVLTSPGEADLSAHVDFSAVADTLRRSGFAIDGPVTQAEFLGRLGAMERASRLIAANPARANEIETGIGRLMNPQGMGTRFKVIGARSPDLPRLPGF